MNALGRVLRQHRALRWLVPMGVLGAVGAVAGGMISASASSDPLPPTTPSALLADMRGATSHGFSGTLIAQMSLGLQPPTESSAGSDVSIASLLAGSHTLRYWYAGPQLQRVALLGTTDETDVFRSGSDVWQWDSSDAVAVHATVHGQVSQPLAPPSIGSLTPQQLVTRLVASLDPATTVTVDGTRTVADRDAYVLVLTPRDSSTRVASVRIAVDGTTKIPLGVQVYARGGSTAALDVAFSDVSFATPSPANFAFTPPPGAKVTEGFGTVAEAGSAPRASIIGTGWSSVVEYHAASAAVGALAGGTLLRMTPVSGAWGKGRLLDLPLFSVLVADDGRVFAGAVDPDVLYRAAAAHN